MARYTVHVIFNVKINCKHACNLNKRIMSALEYYEWHPLLAVFYVHACNKFHEWKRSCTISVTLMWSYDVHHWSVQKVTAKHNSRSSKLTGICGAPEVPKDDTFTILCPQVIKVTVANCDIFILCMQIKYVVGTSSYLMYTR